MKKASIFLSKRRHVKAAIANFKHEARVVLGNLICGIYFVIMTQ